MGLITKVLRTVKAIDEFHNNFKVEILFEMICNCTN